MKQSEHLNIIKNKLQKLSISTSDGFQLIDFDSILYLKADNNYTTFFLTDGSKIVATKNLGYFEQKLSLEPFLRIHHSFIVNLTKVTKYSKSSVGQIILNNNKSLPVSRNRKESVLLFFTL